MCDKMDETDFLEEYFDVKLTSYQKLLLKLLQRSGFFENNYSYDSPHFPPDYCRYCSNNPANGGSGICHCILGTQTIC